jgi:hypothetical protein
MTRQVIRFNLRQDGMIPQYHIYLLNFLIAQPVFNPLVAIRNSTMARSKEYEILELFEATFRYILDCPLVYSDTRGHPRR